MCVEKVEFTVYVTIITPTLIANLLGFVYNMVERINNARKEIENKSRKDSSGLLLKRSKLEMKLLNFKFDKSITILNYSLVASFVCLLVYGISLNIEYLWDTMFYKCFVSILTYLGLIPGVLSFYYSFRILNYYIKLSRYDPHKC